MGQEDSQSSAHRQSNASSSRSIAAAREKLQNSARELYKNLEDAMSKKDGAVEGVFHVLFGACTAGGASSVDDQVVPASSSTSHSKSHSPPTSQRRSTTATASQDLGDNVYAQLFFDDQLRAAKSSSEIPKPFPVSSPGALKHGNNRTNDIITRELNIPDYSFDDGISTISAHTLEAMAQTPVRQTRNETSYTPPSTWRAQVTPSPIGMNRGRSQQSYKSFKSQSTKTTESSSFECWRQEEAKFWKEQVQHETSGRRKAQHAHETHHFEPEFPEISEEVAEI